MGDANVIGFLVAQVATGQAEAGGRGPGEVRREGAEEAGRGSEANASGKTPPQSR